MSAISKNLRKRADEQREHSLPLFDEKLLAKPTNLALFVIGQVSANVFEALADISEVEDAKGNELTASRKKLLDRNEQIRLAAAKGDWSEFDRLAAGGDIQPE